MPKPYITGYCDPLTVRAGDSMLFMLSAEGVNEADVQLVRLVHGDEHEGGPGLRRAGDRL